MPLIKGKKTEMTSQMWQEGGGLDLINNQVSSYPTKKKSVIFNDTDYKDRINNLHVNDQYILSLAD